MLQNNTSGKANNTTILHKYGYILFVVISRHEPITLSVPPTFQCNLIKQRIIQQSSRIITCRVAYHHLSLFWILHKLKKTKKNISYLTLSTNRQLFHSQARICYATGVHWPPAYTIRWINVGAMLFHRMQRQPCTKTASGQRPVSAVHLPA